MCLPVIVIDNVGAQGREVDLLLVLGEQVKAVVESVVADDLRVVADVVVGLGHAVRLTGLGDAFLLCAVVGQRGALDRVIIVDQEHRVSGSMHVTCQAPPRPGNGALAK